MMVVKNLEGKYIETRGRRISLEDADQKMTMGKMKNYEEKMSA